MRQVVALYNLNRALADEPLYSGQDVLLPAPATRNPISVVTSPSAVDPSAPPKPSPAGSAVTPGARSRISPAAALSPASSATPTRSMSGLNPVGSPGSPAMSPRALEDFRQALEQGVELTKISRGRFASNPTIVLQLQDTAAGVRLFWRRADKPGRRGEHSFKLSEIKDVVFGRATDTLRKRGKESLEHCYFALLVSTRDRDSLDLQAPNETECRSLVAGLRQLLQIS